MDENAIEDALFEEAKTEFESEYPLVQFLDAATELEIVIEMIMKPEYTTMSLEDELGTASQFTEVDTDTGEITISPGIT